MSRRPLLLKDFDTEVLSTPGDLIYIKVHSGPKGQEYAASSYRRLTSARLVDGHFVLQLGKMSLGKPVCGWTMARLERAYEQAMAQTDVKRLITTNPVKRTRKVPLKLDEVEVRFLDHDGVAVTYWDTGTHCGVNCVLDCDGPGSEVGWDCETGINLYRRPA